MEAKSRSVDPEEIERFSRIADEWWSPHGKFKPLHDINPLRIGWILNQVTGHRAQETDKKSSVTRHPSPVSLQGKALLDIGCGGGLICEPFARLGAKVTGIDAGEKNIAVAKLHAQQSGLEIDYRCTTAEELVTGNRTQEAEKEDSVTCNPLPVTYDIVFALEIIEHVADIPAFVEATCKLVKPGGLIFYSTINRTLKSYTLAIVGAEYVLRWLPRGTHQWNKFVKPSELAAHLRQGGVELTEMTGMTLNPLSWKWQLAPKDLDVNYLACGIKR
jgi:2-polyprenyl-6-hydroxyphenyl methylase/3-demethylubiquinone-9 3-methyltransferase